MRLDGATLADRRLPRRRAPFPLLLLGAIVVAVIALSAGPARAASPIEGVWSFNGGKVAVQAQPDGSFRGVVVAPTKFSQCFHPVGEEMWTEIRQQPDGSYWGLHQWYFATSDCVPNPQLGLSAWRVLTAADGSKSLEVCFSAPGSQSQPTVPPSGAGTGATFGCSASARVSALPIVSASEAGKYIQLPDNGPCLSRAKLLLRLRNPAGDPIAKAVVSLKSGKVRRRAKLTHKKNGILATLNLRGLPSPTFKVTVRVTTVLGARLKAKRTYRTCGTTPVRKHRHRKHRA